MSLVLLHTCNIVYMSEVVRGKMERGAEAEISGEQTELELETSPANDNQSLPCAGPGDGLHDQEEGEDVDDGKPPDYDSLSLAQQELPSLHNKSNTFIAEAPPSYQQLFGRKALSSSSQRRPHTRARRRGTQQSNASSSSGSFISQFRQRYPRLSKLIVRLTVVCAILCLVGLSAAMILVGSFNFNVCSSGEVPIYLLVAGMLMIAELLFHGVLWLLMKYSDSDSTYKALRMCDCVAFVLLIWLLIGSNWVFKLSIARYSTTSACSTMHPIDDVIRLNTTAVTDGSGGTHWVIISESAPDSTHPSSSCMDCSSGVYQFTVLVILLQYIAALVVLVGCCSKILKK